MNNPTPLRHSGDCFASVFRANPVPLTLQHAGNEKYVDVNDSFLRLTGFLREEVLGHTPVDLSLFPEPESLQDVRQALANRRPMHNVQAGLQGNGGTMLQVLISAETLDLEGEAHCLMSFQDITESLRLEEQRHQAQRMEAVGQFAANVAHDFNNLLTVIQGHAELQLNVGHPDGLLRNSLQQITRTAARAASLTRQMLAFSRKQLLHPRPLDVAQTLERLGITLRRVLGEPVTLRIECAENLPPALADSANFEQIILDLAVFARESMPNGGPLIISAEPVKIDAAYRERVPDAVLGRFIRLSIADKGEGMDETVQCRLFEPFFTTKGIGKGTGMGLATVYGIVKQHQGWIEVESAPGDGSVFKVFLPAADAATGQPDATQNQPLQPGRAAPKTILLVEDETPLREMAANILKQLGHRVVVARDGPEALALWAQLREKIDLLLTDMVMPGGMTGQELADHLLRNEPHLRVIYSTGYSAELFRSNINLVQGVNCLFKPYDASKLADAVNRVFAPAA